MGVDFAEAMLVASRALRKAGRVPSSAVVEAMERCTAAYRAWDGIWAEAETAQMADAHSPMPTATAPQEHADNADCGPLRITVGLADIMSTMLKAKRS